MIMKKQLQNGNFYLAVALLVMAVLFYSSSQTYEQQSQVSLLQHWLAGEPFKDKLSGISFLYGGSEVSIAHSGYAKFVEFFIRKAAHFTTYFLLGGSWLLGLRPKMQQTILLPGVIAWLSATGYAALDEFHQMLTGGRTPLFQDVVLDSIGAATAVLICWLILGIKKLRK